MQRLLVENTRRRVGPESRGGYQWIEVSRVDSQADGPWLDFSALGEALEESATKRLLDFQVLHDSRRTSPEELIP